MTHPSRGMPSRRTAPRIERRRLPRRNRREGDVHSQADRPPLDRDDDRRLTLLHRQHEADMPTHLPLGGAAAGAHRRPATRGRPEQKCSPVPVIWITRTDSSDEVSVDDVDQTEHHVVGQRVDRADQQTANTPLLCSTTRPSIAGYDFIGSPISRNAYKMRLGVSRTDDHNTIRAAAQAGHDQRPRGLARCSLRPRCHSCSTTSVDYEACTRPSRTRDGRRNLAGAYGGLDPTVEQAKAIEDVIGPPTSDASTPRPTTAPPLFVPVPRNNVSASSRRSSATKNAGASAEPGAGSDLASLSMKAELDGDEWVLSGQKVWSTWAHHSEFARLARTDPDAPKRRGISYFSSTSVLPASTYASSAIWVAKSTSTKCGSTRCVSAFNSSGRSTMAKGRRRNPRRRAADGRRPGSGGVDRTVIRRRPLLATYRELCIDHPVTRTPHELHAEEHIRQSTNARGGHGQGRRHTRPAASIGKVHQGRLNQQLQLAACDLSGMEAIAWEGDWLDDMPYATKGMIRSRANTIEGGTTEVNKNVLGEKVLGLPREPDPYRGVAWKETPR